MNEEKREISFNPNFWAKKWEKDGIFKWLPLKQHLMDTMHISELLWEHWLSEGQRDLIINSLNPSDEISAKKLVGFLGAVHDIGKATPAFQTKEGFLYSKDLDYELIDRLEKNGFTNLGSLQLMDVYRSPHALAGEALLASYGIYDDIGSIIGGHHGKPIDEKSQYSQQLGSYTANYFQEERDNHPIYQKWYQSQKNIFNWALKETGFNSIENLPTIKLPAQIILSGLLIMADWIASNERYFPLFSLDQFESEDSEARRSNGWLKWIKTYIEEPQIQYEIDEVFHNRFGFSPLEVQKRLSQEVINAKNPGIFIIEAPMGIGKTEAALVAAEHLATKTGRRGLYFGLPTQATSDGIFPRIKSWLDSIAQSYGNEVSLQLVHGKSALNKDFKNIAASNVNVDNDSIETVVVNEWFSGKKTAVLDDFVVGTIDQFLLSSLKQKHLALRHLGFSRKVIIIDEVHAYDAYMGQYLFQSLRWMGAYNVPVIILSATLPSEKRTKLIENYMRGSGIKWREVIKPDEWESTAAYPLITYSDGNEIKQVTNFAPSTNVEVEVISLKEDKLIDTLDGLLTEGGIAGVIVNTVKRAQELARIFIEVYGEETVELLHSGFISTHRIDKEKNLIKIIGKGAKRPYKKIIIGTQVIEQSLDIDFDVLISDLAPMDLLLQRIGRLHRHQITNRPKKLLKPVLYVMGIDDNLEFEGGSSAVYGDYLLIRTQYFLSEVINIPEDISPLVQKVYGEENPELPDCLHAKYVEAKEKAKILIACKERKAKHFRIDEPNKSKQNDLIGWLKNTSPNDSEEKGFAQVRDSGDSVEVIVVKKWGDGYAIFDDNSDISKHINEFEIGKELATQTLRLPNPLCAVYSIDKTIEELENFNKQFLRKWQEQIWLKGSLGIIFDENNQFSLNGYLLSYHQKYGLMYEKED